MGGRRRRRAAPYGCGACAAPACGRHWPAAPGGWWPRGDVPGVDIGCGVGRAQRCVPAVRRRMVCLRPLRNLAERPHRGGP